MKKTLLIAALSMMAAPAMASKARLTSLSSAAHLSDIQDVFTNASKLTASGDWATFETGSTPAANKTASGTSPQAEGGFARSMGDAKYGFYLGHSSQFVTGTRLPNTHENTTNTPLVTQTHLIDENPLNLFYASKMGDMAWGIGMNYSNSNKKTVSKKQSAMGINGGITMGNLYVGLDLGLSNSYKDDTAGSLVDFKGKTSYQIAGTYVMNDLTIAYGLGASGGKEDAVSTATYDISTSNYNLGVVKDHKADGVDFFYGASYAVETYKDDGNNASATALKSKYEQTTMPVIVGIEADAASWLVLRASVKQNVLLGSSKDSFNAAAADDADSIANNTTVSAGAGLKFGKIAVDGTLQATAAATAGQVNGSSLLANASMTYMF